MKFLPTILLFPSLILAIPSHKAAKCCLCDSDVTAILDRWTSFYENNDASAVAALSDKLVTDDLTMEDETFIRAPVPVGTNFVAVNGKKDFIEQNTARLGQPDVAPKRSFRNVFTVHNCDTITFRWAYESTIELDNIGGLPINQTLAPVGTKIQYKGIDILQVDCKSKLIKKVWTSQDWYNQIKNFGFADWAS